MVLSSISIGISSAFSTDLISTTPFKYIKAPKEELDEDTEARVRRAQEEKQNDVEKAVSYFICILYFIYFVLFYKYLFYFRLLVLMLQVVVKNLFIVLKKLVLMEDIKLLKNLQIVHYHVKNY